MSERIISLTPESAGLAPGRGRLVGRRILVIGGGQDSRGQSDPPIGNGRAMACLFAREGAKIAVADRDLGRAQETVNCIAADNGTAIALAADVSKPDDIAALADAAPYEFGGLDGLVYNVGIGIEMGLSGTTAQGWDKTFAVNLRGAALALAAFLPKLDEGSSVVLISSIASMKPGSRIPAYDASKAGLAGLMRHGALEAAPRGIRINIVAPGLMDTSIGREASAGRPSRAKTPVPLGRQGTGWETAYAALFLMGGEGAYITGQVITVDGGLTALR